MKKRILIFNHRGAFGNVFEPNSYDAILFSLEAESNYESAECDLVLTKDGYGIIAHDPIDENANEINKKYKTLISYDSLLKLLSYKKYRKKRLYLDIKIPHHKLNIAALLKSISKFGKRIFIGVNGYTYLREIILWTNILELTDKKYKRPIFVQGIPQPIRSAILGPKSKPKYMQMDFIDNFLSINKLDHLRKEMHEYKLKHPEKFAPDYLHAYFNHHIIMLILNEGKIGPFKFGISRGNRLDYQDLIHMHSPDIDENRILYKFISSVPHIPIIKYIQKMWLYRFFYLSPKKGYKVIAPSDSSRKEMMDYINEGKVDGIMPNIPEIPHMDIPLHNQKLHRLKEMAFEKNPYLYLGKIVDHIEKRKKQLKAKGFDQFIFTTNLAK